MGGAIHPDELLDRLTHRQWVEWQKYVANFQTPMRRADINSALERQQQWPMHGGKAPPLDSLIPKYGRKREIPTAAEQNSKLAAWARANSA